MEDGSGLAQAIPSLTKSIYKRGDLKIACLIRNGIAGSEQLNMPANKDLTPSEITNIINFMRNEFWRDPRFAHPEKVEKALKKCE